MNDDRSIDQTDQLKSPPLTWLMPPPGAPARGKLWYFIWFLVIALLAAAALALHFLFGFWQFWTVAGLGIVVLVALMVVSGKAEQPITYTLSTDDIGIGNQHFSWDTFRAFTINGNGDDWRIELIPQKRFGATEVLPIPAEQGEAIVDTLGDRLPMERANASLVERMIRYLKISA